MSACLTPAPPGGQISGPRSDPPPPLAERAQTSGSLLGVSICGSGLLRKFWIWTGADRSGDRVRFHKNVVGASEVAQTHAQTHSEQFQCCSGSGRGATGSASTRDGRAGGRKQRGGSGASPTPPGETTGSDGDDCMPEVRPFNGDLHSASIFGWQQCRCYNLHAPLLAAIHNPTSVRFAQCLPLCHKYWLCKLAGCAGSGGSRGSGGAAG